MVINVGTVNLEVKVEHVIHFQSAGCEGLTV